MPLKKWQIMGVLFFTIPLYGRVPVWEFGPALLQSNQQFAVGSMIGVAMPFPVWKGTFYFHPVVPVWFTKELGKGMWLLPAIKNPSKTFSFLSDKKYASLYLQELSYEKENLAFGIYTRSIKKIPIDTWESYLALVDPDLPMPGSFWFAGDATVDQNWFLSSNKIENSDQWLGGYSKTFSSLTFRANVFFDADQYQKLSFYQGNVSTTLLLSKSFFVTGKVEAGAQSSQAFYRVQFGAGFQTHEYLWQLSSCLKEKTVPPFGYVNQAFAFREEQQYGMACFSLQVKPKQNGFYFASLYESNSAGSIKTGYRFLLQKNVLYISYLTESIKSWQQWKDFSKNNHFVVMELERELIRNLVMLRLHFYRNFSYHPEVKAYLSLFAYF
ncbi:MAG: hypothetical protein D6767_07245 [Candidatus Hydrogenedentota bacterium]|nr:MAG: hypothetical protein D6767_07245 [Candidatus Hydrogenedentota bacterium]